MFQNTVTKDWHSDGCLERLSSKPAEVMAVFVKLKSLDFCFKTAVKVTFWGVSGGLSVLYVCACAFVCICVLVRGFFSSTCQVKVVRFYVSQLLRILLLFPLLLLWCRAAVIFAGLRSSALSLPCWGLAATVPVGSQPQPSAHSVPCRTSAVTRCAPLTLPGLNRDSLRSAFPGGPQPRLSLLRAPSRTSTAR